MYELIDECANLPFILVLYVWEISVNNWKQVLFLSLQTQPFSIICLISRLTEVAMKFRSLFGKLSLPKLAFPILQYSLGKQPNTFFPCYKIKRGKLVRMVRAPYHGLLPYREIACILWCYLPWLKKGKSISRRKTKHILKLINHSFCSR